ncbi:MAG: MSMEG_4193 family putative phosphomutase [Chloroflexota bacterium]
MTELLLIRHAVNDYVKTHRLAGWTPGVHLNDDGRAQAAALGLRLAEKTIHAIYSSPLERTIETAQAVIVHHPDLTVQLLEGVGEVRYGDWTGEEIRKLAQRKMWRVIQGNPSRASFPNGEAMRDVQLRAVNALEKLVIKHPRETVAVVSHSDVIKMILAHYMGMHLDLFQRIDVAPASLSIISMSGGRPFIHQVNETSYLPKPLKHHAPAFDEAYEQKKAVHSVTVDAVGEPRSRTFYVQATRETGEVATVLIEKTQALLLAEQIEALFKQHPDLATLRTAEVPTLQNPEPVLFRAGKFELHYNVEIGLVSVNIIEMLGVDQATPEVLNLWASVPELRTLAEHAQQVARSGAASQP